MNPWPLMHERTALTTSLIVCRGEQVWMTPFSQKRLPKLVHIPRTHRTISVTFSVAIKPVNPTIIPTKRDLKPSTSLYLCCSVV